MTLIADALTAVAITQCEYPARTIGLLLPISLAMYWAGMILNDWFDIEKDRQQRSQRPLACGAISLHQAGRVGWGLLLLAAIGCGAILFWMQSDRWLYVLPLFIVSHALQWLARGMAGSGWAGWPALLAPGMEALLWPVATVLLLAPQRRAHDPDENRPI